MITLRSFREEDIPALQQLLNDQAVTRFLSTKIPEPYTEDDARWWVTEGSLHGINRAITFNGQFAGSVGVNPGQFEYARSGELGYWLGRDFWRQGITYEAVLQITEFVFSHTDIVRIFATVFAGNEASMGLLMKAGFHHEASLRNAIYKHGQFFDSQLFVKFKASINSIGSVG